MISTLTWDVADNWQIQWGANYEKQDVIEQRWRTINNQRIRDEGNAIWNFHYNYNNYGTYVQVDNSPVQWLSWNAALRADRLSGDFTSKDNDGVSTEKEMYNFGTILQPKLNVFVYPTEDVVLFANYTGRSSRYSARVLTLRVIVMPGIFPSMMVGKLVQNGRFLTRCKPVCLTGNSMPKTSSCL